LASPWVRLLLIGVGLWIGVTHLERGDAFGWLPVGAALVLVYEHFRRGTVHWAYQAFRRGDIERARRRLAHTPFPKLLRAREQAYRFLLLGAAALRDDDHDTARARLITAFEGRLRSPRDRAIVAMILTQVEREAGREDHARRWAKESRSHWRDAEIEGVFARMGLGEEE